jgi:flagellin-specific chaperone FliS
MNKSPNPFDRYLELLPKFVVRYGEERKWSPIQINKTFLLLMIEELGIIPTFSLHKRRVVSVTQQILHRDYSNGTIITNPTELETPIRINRRSDLNVLEEYGSEIDIIYDALKEKGIKTPYILDSDKIKKKVQKIGKPETSYKEQIKLIEEMADKSENLITNCKRLDYIHPKLENKDIQKKCKKLDSLPRLLKDLKNKLFETKEPNNDYLDRTS